MFYWELGRVVFNPIALRKAKIVCNFGLSECNRVKLPPMLHLILQRIKKKQQKIKMNLENPERRHYVVWVYLQISAPFLFGQYFMGYR